jgi:hypothetical protein
MSATTSDLYVYGIDILVVEERAGHNVAWKLGATTPGHILQSALCRGLMFKGIKDARGADYVVTLYLDDSE